MAISTLCQRAPRKYLHQGTCTDKRGEGVGSCRRWQLCANFSEFFGAQAACASPTCGCPAALTVMTCRAGQDSSDYYYYYYYSCLLGCLLACLLTLGPKAYPTLQRSARSLSERLSARPSLPVVSRPPGKPGPASRTPVEEKHTRRAVQ